MNEKIKMFKILSVARRTFKLFKGQTKGTTQSENIISLGTHLLQQTYYLHYFASVNDFCC